MSNPFQQIKNNVPIIGQPFTLKGFFVTVQIQCNCAGKEPVLLVGNGLGKCPACDRTYQMQGVRPGPNGQLQFAIGQVVAPHAQELAAVGGKETH